MGEKIQKRSRSRPTRGYWGSAEERAERWAEITMRAESLKVVYPVVDDGRDYAPSLKDLPVHERAFGRPPIALPDKEHQHQHLGQRPAPRCWERCHWGYLTSERCPNRCIHAQGHRLSHDCSQHGRRPKQPPPPRPPRWRQVRSSGNETEVGLQAAPHSQSQDSRSRSGLSSPRPSTNRISAGISTNRHCACCGATMEQNTASETSACTEYCVMCSGEPKCGSCAWSLGQTDMRWHRLTTSANQRQGTLVERTVSGPEARDRVLCCHCFEEEHLDPEQPLPIDRGRPAGWKTCSERRLYMRTLPNGARVIQHYCSHHGR